MSETVQTENKMGVMPVKKLIVSMSLPMMISMLVQALYNIVDSIFVSQINENALTAVTLAFPMQMLVISFGGGTGVGINALLSKALGEKRFDRADKAANTGIFFWDFLRQVRLSGVKRPTPRLSLLVLLIFPLC